MTMRARASSLLFSLIASFLVTGVATAYACHEPTLGSLPGEYRAGETVPFSVSGAQEGANYSLEVEGHTVAGGTVTSDGGFNSTFVMPDLGSSGTYYAYLEITHEGHSGSGSWPSSQEIRFEVPAAGNGESTSNDQQQEQQQGSQQKGPEGSQKDGSAPGARDESAQLQPITTASSPALSQAQQTQRAHSGKTAQYSDKAADGALRAERTANPVVERPAVSVLTRRMAAIGTYVSDFTVADDHGVIGETFGGVMEDVLPSSAEDAEATDRPDIDIFVLAAAALAIMLVLLLRARRPPSAAPVIPFPRPESKDVRKDTAA